MRNNILNGVGIIIYRILLDKLYIDGLVPVYNSEGYENDASEKSVIISWIVLLFFLPIILQIFKKSTFSAHTIVLLFLVQYVPITSMMAYMPMKLEFFVLYNLYWFFLLGLYLVTPNLSISDIKPKVGITKPLLVIISVCSLSIIFVSGYYFGFRLTVDLVDVYGIREESTSSGMPAIFDYILPAAANILPVVLVYFIDKKDIKMISILSFVILLNFSIGGHKAIFFNLVLAFLGYFFFKKTLITKFTWFLSFLVLISILEYKYVDTFFTMGYVARRLMFVPAWLNYYYYDFFSTHEFDFYRQSFIRHLGINSPYDDTIPHVIGDFMGVPGQGSNNGLFSDAYANLGMLGVIVLPIILILILKLFDGYSKGIEKRYLFLPIVACATTLISSFLPTALLTHGLLLLMFVLYLFPRKQKVN